MVDFEPNNLERFWLRLEIYSQARKSGRTKNIDKIIERSKKIEGYVLGPPPDNIRSIKRD